VHRSFVSLRADGVIAGFGIRGCLLALRRVAKLIGEAPAATRRALTAIAAAPGDTDMAKPGRRVYRDYSFVLTRGV
jgi:hypothetical protein